MDIIDTLKERGFIAQITREKELRDALSAGPVTLYVGFDPSGDSLHVGHLLPIMVMGWLQRAGHKVIAVVGGGTGRIGDPSGKTEMRQLLTDERIEHNIQGLTSQLVRFIDINDDNGRIVNNADWLLQLNYISFLREIGSKFSVNRMLAAEAYKQRLETGLSFIEFNYQILQAYDFLHLNRQYGCSLQVGGDDQWGNIVAGTDLIRRETENTAFGLTIPLLTTATGAKMGKTAKGAVWLDANKLSAFDYYQYWLNVDDRDVTKLLKLYTLLPMPAIAELDALTGADIRKAKAVLAFETTKLAHGEEAAVAAVAGAKAMLAGAGTAEMPTHAITAAALAEGMMLIQVLAESNMTQSNGEGRRLIKGGGVKLNNTRVTDPNASLCATDFSPDAVIRVGKKRALKVTINDT